MRFTKTALTIVFCLLWATCAYSQRSKSGGGRSTYTRSANSRPPIRMSRAKAKIVCPIFEDTGYPYHGLGIKVGDPFALTYKLYPNKHFAVAVDFGRSASGLYSSYYSDLFDEFYPDTADTLDYYSHKVKSDWVGEVKFLYQFNAEKISPGLQVYVGAGWEIRNLTLQYDYFSEEVSLPKNYRDQHSRLTQGIQGVAGIEYSYFKLPISAFMELEYYYDVMKDPGWTKIQGGVGLRYVF
jgi:hypothetical protein